ncbi:Ig domain-containing protein [Micromonospora sp. NPDC001898]|uniref:Ig domain-containing protein n=1 Tax=Micromonospora sp. NPDC001898 TaxID=3364221 RepID=UPI0036BEE68D
MVEITTPDPLPPGTVGQPYHLELRAAHGIPPYSWSTANGELPYGLALDDGGLVAGVPKAEVILSVQVCVQDSAEPAPQSARKWLNIVIRPAGRFLITTAELPPAKQNTSYRTALAATGGAPPYVWSVDRDSLPVGIELDATTGTLAGTPASPGSSSCEFEVTDDAGNHAARTLPLTVLGELGVTTTDLPAAMDQRPYDVTLRAGGGAPPYTWAVATGALPAGIELDAVTGRLSGTPQSTGTCAVSFTVTDSQQSHASSATIPLTVAPTACLATITSFTGRVEVVVPDVRNRVIVSWQTEGAAVVYFDREVGQFANPGPSGRVSIEYRTSISGPIDPPVLPGTITCVDQYGLSVLAPIRRAVDASRSAVPGRSRSTP